MWQALHVQRRLREAYPGCEVEILGMTTEGDRVLDRALNEIGGKGLFTKELEVALLDGRADLAVHSLKDVPMSLEPGFALAAILPRADHADAFVSNRFNGLDDLPQGACVGTSSLRRQAQLRALRPDLQLRDLRGNVNTRLAKLDAGDYDAIVLACAGLQRLGFNARIRARLDAPGWLPAPAQGAIAIETRDGDPRVATLCAALDDAATRTCVAAERAMNRALDGSCHVPVAGLAALQGERLLLQGLVGATADGRCIRAQAEGPATDPQALGVEVAQALLAQGARALIDS